MKKFAVLMAAFTAISSAIASAATPTISGDYLEVRSCDVFTGPCFANAEMGLTGKEGILVWSVRDGQWKGTAVAGLNVIAVVSTDATLGDLRYHPRKGKAVLIVDSKATSAQREALADFAKTMAGELVNDVVEVKTSDIAVDMATCNSAGCASVKAAGLVEISTRCIGGKDHLCGNEENFYPPLTTVQNPLPAFSEVAAYRGDGLGLTWQGTGQRNVYLAKFAR